MKFAHVHIPKTAGGSVNDWFKRYNPNSLVFNTHKTIDKCQTKFDLSFCILRNTYYRLISAYEFAKSQALRKYNKRLSKGDIKGAAEAFNMNTTDTDIISWLSYHIETDNNVVWPLDKWTKNVDIILNQENLIEDFKLIQEKLNCFRPLQKTQHVLNYSKEKYLTEDYIAFVYKHFYKEIDKYNYKVL